MRRPLLLALALAVAPSVARSQEAPGPVVGLSLAGGGELGLASRFSKGVGELALLGGWELGAYGLRPELSFALGVQPDRNVAVRPGLSWSPGEYPFRVRVAFDASNARDRGLHWRWLLLGAAYEVRLTGRLSLDAGVDVGSFLGNDIGVPVLFRVGATLHL